MEKLYDKDLFGNEVVKESKPQVQEEKTITIKGEEIPERIYNLCITHYLSILYGDCEDYKKQ